MIRTPDQNDEGGDDLHWWSPSLKRGSTRKVRLVSTQRGGRKEFLFVSHRSGLSDYVLRSGPCVTRVPLESWGTHVSSRVSPVVRRTRDDWGCDPWDRRIDDLFREKCSGSWRLYRGGRPGRGCRDPASGKLTSTFSTELG